ncbi:MAG: TlpA family protein disulfide reductase [Burkholderiales bacterium]|nr:TlpA family protein disulfide reductase [Burkholderiales bacterium]
MTKAVFALLGVVILGISAGAVYRELISPGKSAGGASIPDVAATGGAPEAGRAGSARTLPDLRFVDGTGAPRSLADFRGRVILLNLWATWCVPCRKEMPALDRLQAALGGPGFEVVALSIDQGGIAAVKRFYEELEVRHLRIYVDPNGDALGKMGSVGIPLSILVDRDGRELWRVVGPREWDAQEAVRAISGHLGPAATR